MNQRELLSEPGIPTCGCGHDNWGFQLRAPAMTGPQPGTHSVSRQWPCCPGPTPGAPVALLTRLPSGGPSQPLDRRSACQPPTVFCDCCLPCRL